MLEILGWIIVVWLAGSTIYSTQFHLKNYFRSRNSDSVLAEDLTGPGQTSLMDRKLFLKRVLSMQAVKLVIILLLVYFLIN